MLYRYEGNSTNDTLVIPDEIDGQPVVALDSFSVAASENVKFVVIGKNVTSIDRRAFCGSLHIEKYTVDEENPSYKSVDGVLFSKDGKKLLAYPNARKDGEGKTVTEYAIPDTVEEIGETAFYFNNSLEKVIFPASLQKIDDYGFIKCSALTEIVLNEGLTEIGVDSFSFCDAVQKIVLPSTLQKIGDYAFFSQSSNKNLVFQANCLQANVQCGTDWKPSVNGLKSGEITPESWR